MEHAAATVEFLASKFTNAELFDWMSGVLQEVYRYFLQQATITAKLAERQLRFERQETLPSFIQSDYWRSSDAGTDRGPDRRGLTGSARLLRDITQLDEYAFQTDRRKLQLVKTFSLAHLAPVAFQRFLENGRLVFVTPMETFDRDFPATICASSGACARLSSPSSHPRRASAACSPARLPHGSWWRKVDSAR